MQRVLIIGAPGAGKTTLANRLGEITGLPVSHTDDMLFRGEWEYRAPEETLRLATKASAGERWVIEGAYLDEFQHRVARADHVIVLSTPVLVRIRRIVFRWAANYSSDRRTRGTRHSALISQLIRLLRMTTISYPSQSVPLVNNILNKASNCTKVYEIKTLGELEKVYSEAQYYTDR